MMCGGASGDDIRIYENFILIGRQYIVIVTLFLNKANKLTPYSKNIHTHQ